MKKAIVSVLFIIVSITFVFGRAGDVFFSPGNDVFQYPFALLEKRESNIYFSSHAPFDSIVSETILNPAFKIVKARYQDGRVLTFNCELIPIDSRFYDYKDENNPFDGLYFSAEKSLLYAVDCRNSKMIFYNLKTYELYQRKIEVVLEDYPYANILNDDEYQKITLNPLVPDPNSGVFNLVGQDGSNNQFVCVDWKRTESEEETNIKKSIKLNKFNLFKGEVSIFNLAGKKIASFKSEKSAYINLKSRINLANTPLLIKFKSGYVKKVLFKSRRKKVW